MSEPEYISPEDVEATQALVKSGESYVALAEIMVIETLDHYTSADKFMVLCGNEIRQAEDECNPRINQAHKLHRSLCTDKNNLIDPFKQAVEIVKPKMRAFKREQERKAEEEAARQRKIQLEEEAKRQAALEQNKMDEAELLEKQGRHSEASAVLNAPDPMENKPIAAPIARPAVPKTQTQLRKDWDIKVVNQALVPDEFKDVSISRIKARVRSYDGKVEIAGCVIREI